MRLPADAITPDGNRSRRISRGKGSASCHAPCRRTDKRTVLLKCGTHDKSSRQVVTELKRIEDLRNSLAHSGDYALTEDAADGMIETVALAQSWIRTIPGLSPKPKA